MTNEKMQALANLFDTTIEDLEVEQCTYNENEFSTIEGDFLVLTDEEADEEVKDRIQMLIDDMGIQTFTPSFQDTIINNYMSCSWFDDAMRESYEFYIDDIRDECGINYDDGGELLTRLQEEMEEAEAEDEEQFLDYLCEQWESGMEWFKSSFGEDEFSREIVDRGELDIDSIVEDCIAMDGRGHNINSWDGSESEELVNNTWYYIYNA